MFFNYNSPISGSLYGEIGFNLYVLRVTDKRSMVNRCLKLMNY